jgi:DNA methylase
MLNSNELFQDSLQFATDASERDNSPKVVDELPAEANIADGEIFIIRNTTSRYLTHLFHKYAGKFIPHIPRWALRRFLRRNQEAVVLDPFVGSGTTLAEALLYGQNSFGVDVDPLARLIAKVKTTVIPESRLWTLPEEVIEALDGTTYGSYVPRIPTLSHWFNDQAVSDLSAIYEAVEKFRGEPDVYDFLLICFSSIIRRASNADNQTMKTYVSHTNPKQPEAARALFVTTLKSYTDSLIKFGRLAPDNVRATVMAADDARTLDSVWREQRLPPVELGITSPPYIKSVDYIYNQMAELFWIGERWGLETQAKQNVFKRKYIGNDRPSGGESQTMRATGLGDVDEYISKVFEGDRSLALIMWRYFRDMEAHFSAMRSILRPGAHYIMVIGDSTLAGVPVPTHTLLTSCAQRCGFRFASQFAYEIRNKYMRFPRGGRGGVVVHDWVIDLVNE